MDNRNYHRHTMSFPDLRVLCRELGLKQMGRKEELQQRLVAHLQADEGSHRCLRSGGSPQLRNFMAVLCLPPLNSRPMAGPSDPGLNCICNGAGGQTPLIQCPRCQSFQHRACLGRAIAMRNYECPQCQMRQMDPFEQVLGVLVCATLCQTFGGGMAQRAFEYPQDLHAKLLEPGRARMVQIRCVRLDGEGYVQHWPKDCAILVNGRTIFTVQPQPQSSPRKRVDSAINITNLSPGSLNQAMVLKQREDDNYAFAIFIIEHLDLDTVYNRFHYERVLTMEAGRAFIRNRISSGEDLTPEASRQSLKCPITRLLPEMPTRGWQCRHIQCFDLFPYILMQMQSSTNRWRCPVCFNTVIHMSVDKYMKSIIERAREIQCDSVEFQPNGLYKLIADDRPELSDDENPSKRPGSASGDQPSKRLKPEPGAKKLCWRDFETCKTHADSITREILHSCYTYQLALQVKLKGTRIVPRTQSRHESRPPPPYCPLLPIEID